MKTLAKLTIIGSKGGPRGSKEDNIGQVESKGAKRTKKGTTGDNRAQKATKWDNRGQKGPTEAKSSQWVPNMAKKGT